MKPLDYYISQTMSPFDEIDADDQISLVEKGLLKFKQDSILLTIGTKECKTNIYLFLDELVKELDPVQFQVYLDKIINKIISVYSLNFLKDYLNQNYNKSDNYVYILELLKFLELDFWQEKIAHCIPGKIDINHYTDLVYMSNLLKSELKPIHIALQDRKEEFPEFLRICFIYSSSEDILNFLNKLVVKDTITVVINQL